MKQLSPKLKAAKRLLTLFALLLMGQLSFAQTHQTIKGVITDARNKEPLAGATVRLEGTTFATSTDAAGAYTLNANVKNGAWSLVISFTGYKVITKTVTLDQSTVTFNTALNENALSLGEVVVTGTTVAVTKKEIMLSRHHSCSFHESS